VWGVTFASTRALLVDFSALEILVTRFVIAWAALLVIGIARRERFRWCGRDEALFAAMGLTGVFVYQFLENCAIYYTSAGNVAILVSCGPVVTAALARLFRRGDGRNFSRMLPGAAIAIGGVSVIACGNYGIPEFRPLGDAMALTAMVSWGFYSILIVGANAKGYSQTCVIRHAFGWALVFMAPLAVWGTTEAGRAVMDGSLSVTLDAGANLARFARPVNLANLGFLGLFASALCFILWNVACRRLGVVRVTIGLYLLPVVGVAFAAVFLGETLTPLSAVGGVMIVGGVVLADRDFWYNSRVMKSRGLREGETTE